MILFRFSLLDEFFELVFKWVFFGSSCRKLNDNFFFFLYDLEVIVFVIFVL